jgi:hypothetical protein
MISELKIYNFKIRLGFRTLASFDFKLKILADFISSIDEKPDSITEPSEIEKNCDGILYKDKKICERVKRLQIGKLIRYIPYFYHHCYINLNSSFDEYKKKFSSKSLSTIKRKINKCKKDGVIDFREYRTADDVKPFFDIALPLSGLTYQEKLLDAGLPSDEDSQTKAIELAKEGNLRAYILFIDGQAAAYLYCPVKNGVLLYSYLGYHPDYAQMSAGTVLQWLALERIFAENKFSLFDFTEGESPHKKYFATDTKLCADVFFLKKNPKSLTAIFCHYTTEVFIKIIKKATRKS